MAPRDTAALILCSLLVSLTALPVYAQSKNFDFSITTLPPYGIVSPGGSIVFTASLISTGSVTRIIFLDCSTDDITISCTIPIDSCRPICNPTVRVTTQAPEPGKKPGTLIGTHTITVTGISITAEGSRKVHNATYTLEVVSGKAVFGESGLPVGATYGVKVNERRFTAEAPSIIIYKNIFGTVTYAFDESVDTSLGTFTCVSRCSGQLNVTQYGSAGVSAIYSKL